MKRYLHLAIHDLHDIERLGSRRISLKLGIPRTTVLRHLRQPRVPDTALSARKPGKLTPYMEEARRLAGDGLSAVQIYRKIAEQGYDGGESTVRNFVRTIRPVRHEAFLELHFEPGEVAQVDFAECGMVRTGEERRKLHAFLMVLGYSRRLFVRFIMRENTEHFLACHREAFERFGGIPRKVMVDNCKVAVVHTDSIYGAAVINPRYADLAAHYGFLPTPCNVLCPNEKGIVERCVGYLRTSFLNGLDTASMTLEALNAAVDNWCRDVADLRQLKGGHGTPQSLFPAEKAALHCLPLMPYDCSSLHNVRISKQCRVTFETNRYSVPMNYAGRMAELSALPDRVQILLDGKCIAEHARCYGRSLAVVAAAHDMELLARRRRAAKGKARELFLGLSARAADYLAELERRRPDWFLHISRILALESEHGKGELANAMENAMAMEAYGAEYIANLLAARRRFKPEPSPLQLTHRTDLLDIDVERADLSAYDF